MTKKAHNTTGNNKKKMMRLQAFKNLDNHLKVENLEIEKFGNWDTNIGTFYEAVLKTTISREKEKVSQQGKVDLETLGMKLEIKTCYYGTGSSQYEMDEKTTHFLVVDLFGDYIVYTMEEYKELLKIDHSLAKSGKFQIKHTKDVRYTKLAKTPKFHGNASIAKALKKIFENGDWSIPVFN